MSRIILPNIKNKLPPFFFLTFKKQPAKVSSIFLLTLKNGGIMFIIYIILAGVIGVIVGVIIGDIKYSLIDKMHNQIDSYFKTKEKEFEAMIGELKNREIKNISAAENKDVKDIKSGIDNITPPKI